MVVQERGMITVVKLNPAGKPKISYSGEVIFRSQKSIVIEAYWKNPALHLGYTSFEPGDRFIEYYYTNRWYNIFDISASNGQRKGWYCNIAQPASISAERIEQVDLYLDVWVSPEGVPLLLDEDEFNSDTMLSEEQRTGAKQGLQDLLERIAAGQEPFSYRSNSD
jgi:protein associated with RNAse G/E